jgi:hypothetical protein
MTLVKNNNKNKNPTIDVKSQNIFHMVVAKKVGVLPTTK